MLLSTKPLYVRALLCLAFLISTPGLVSAATKKELADAADKEINFLDIAVADTQISQGTWVVMWGASCVTPEWLKGQKEFEKRRYQDAGLHMRKVECSIDGEFRSGDPRCDKHAPGGYPTINLYIDGELIEEYEGDGKAGAIVDYMEKQVKAIGTRKDVADKKQLEQARLNSAPDVQASDSVKEASSSKKKGDAEILDQKQGGLKSAQDAQASDAVKKTSGKKEGVAEILDQKQGGLKSAQDAQASDAVKEAVSDEKHVPVRLDQDQKQGKHAAPASETAKKVLSDDKPVPARLDQDQKQDKQTAAAAEDAKKASSPEKEVSTEKADQDQTQATDDVKKAPSHDEKVSAEKSDKDQKKELEEARLKSSQDAQASEDVKKALSHEKEVSTENAKSVSNVSKGFPVSYFFVGALCIIVLMSFVFWWTRRTTATTPKGGSYQRLDRDVMTVWEAPSRADKMA
ncbi:hypothetical protein DFJ77DRAFT_439838 [Powellomyces hirtus]|nr:hypothetical protein DFJ77DRAFT_439838 [Powellomyces hirtus]